MQAFIEQAKGQFDDLDSREKFLAAGGGIALIILLFVFLLLMPAYEKATTLRKEIELNQEDVSWMQNASTQLKNKSGTSNFSGINRSLLALLDEQFKTAGLAGSVKSIQPDGKNKAKVRLENCAFDSLVTLIGKLENDNNVAVLRTNLKNADTSGRINGSISFSRG